MDVRQYNFLAAQASAAVAPRERFWGMPKRGIALILANAMFWQPLLVQAEGIAVSGGNTTVGQAGNGVPVINIATPNANGLSHNQFKDYNVETNGLILNNATGRTQGTQLGGIIVGNPNLTNGAATTILNEVNGGNPSQLKGYTEVAGQSARVIVANPYGITCNGCGFINTPRVTLSTGKPVLSNGQLDHFQVDGGSVTLEGAGLNATNVDQFDIVTRSAKLNAELYANKLNVITGRNDVNAETLAATARSGGDSDKPQLAIDSSALGGMYAGAIKLVGTEAGVGVKLAGDMAASAGDIMIDASGQLTMAQTAASGAVIAKAQRLEAQGPVYAGTGINLQAAESLVNQQSMAARDGIALNSGGQLLNQGIIEAGVNPDNSRNSTGDVSLSAQNLTNRGTIKASRALTAHADQTLDNQGGALSSQAQTVVTAHTLDNQQGRVLSKGTLNLSAQNVVNSQKGLITSTGDLTAAVGQLDNQAGKLSSQAKATITANAIQNNGGLLLGEQGLDTTVAGALDNRQGTVASNKALTLKAGSLDNSQQGTLVSQEAMTTTVNGLLDNNQGQISSQDTLSLTAQTLDSQGGSVAANRDLTLNAQAIDNSLGQISSQGPLNLTTQALNNQQGRVIGRGTLTLTADQLDNSQEGLVTSMGDLTAKVGQLDNQTGELSSQGRASITANSLQNNSGLLLGEQGLDTTVTGALDNRQGTVASNRSMVLSAGSLDNSQQGTVVSQGAMTVVIKGLLDNSAEGAVISKGDQTLVADTLDNRQGQVSSQGLLNLTTQTLHNQGGSIIADQDLALNAGRVENSQGQIASKTNLQATVDSFSQQGGSLISQGALALNANTLENREAGLVAATHGVTLLAGAVDNRGGEISSGQAVTLTGNSLDNSEAGKVIAGTALTLTVDRVSNRLQGVLSGHDSLALTGATLDNSQGGLLSSQTLLDIDLSGALDNHDKGMLVSEGVLNARAGSLDNTTGALSSAGALTLTTTGEVVSRGGQIVTDSSLVLSSATLDNQGGTLSAGSKGNGLTLTTGTLDNSQGDITSGQVLVLKAGQVINTAKGRIASSGDLTADITGLDQHDQGRLFSSQNVTLDLNGGALDNSNQGLLTAPGALVLKNLGVVNNSQDGEISSDHGYVLNAATLDNSSGKLLSGGALDLHIAKALANVKGAISAAGLSVQASSLDNAGGTLVSQRGLELDVKDGLDNSAEGLIAAADDLNIKADLIDNTASGLINSKGALEISANRLDSSDKGEVSSSGDLQLTLNELIQQQGRLIGESGIYLDLQGGDINNLSGLIATHGPLSIQNLRDLNNRDGGEVSSQQSFSLTGRTLDNAAGSLISNGQLNLQADQLNNAGGVISGVKGLVVKGGSLDNSQKGTLSSREGDLAVTLSGVLNNAYDGALVTAGVLEVQSARLDNTKGILSSGSDMSVTTGVLDSASGLISSGGALDLHAQAINNQAGQISADKTLTLTGTSLDNTGGSLGTNADLGVTLLGALTNAEGKIASSAPLVLKAATINNQNGQIISQELMTLETGTLDNSQKGTVAANGDLILNATGAVQNNAEGLIYSQGGKLNLTAEGVNNAAGTLQSQGDLTLTVTQGLNNQGGKAITQASNLLINSGSVDNTDGALASLEGLIDAKVRGLLRNGGVIQGQSLDLTANGGFSNYNGKVSALDGDAIVSTADFDNRNGSLYAARNVAVTGNNFDNSGDADGQVAGHKIDFSLAGALDNHLGIIESATTLAITAASLNNQQGQLRALGQDGTTALNISGLFDNQNGALETANTDLLFNVGSFQNTNGKVLHVGTGNFGLSLKDVSNAGGSLITRGALTLTADSWTNTTSIQAGRLEVNVGDFTQTATGQLLASDAFIGKGTTWVNDGLIASSGSLVMNLTDTYSSSGAISTRGTLDMSANNLLLSQVGSIKGGDKTSLNIGNQLVNYGVLTSSDNLTIAAGSLANLGTLGSNLDLSVRTPTFVNQGGLVFSGRNTTLNVSDLLNTGADPAGSADIYSIGNLLVTGLDENAKANSISNISGHIESNGDLTLESLSVLNDRAQFVMEQELTGGSVSMKCGQHCHGHDKYKRGEVIVERTVDSKILADSPMATLMSGHDLNISSEAFLNRYSLVSAANDLKVVSGDITNQAAYSASGTAKKQVGIGVRIPTAMWDQREANVKAYNKEHSSTFDEAAFSELLSKFDPRYFTGIDTPVEIQTDGKSVAPAIIQAGGNVHLEASNDISNIVVEKTVDALRQRSADTAVQQSVPYTTVTLHTQLPPDLAKQQVNPTTLPGFTLPSGKNGLFRLTDDANRTDIASVDADTMQISRAEVSTKPSMVLGFARASSVDITEGQASSDIEASQSDSDPIARAYSSAIDNGPNVVAVLPGVANDVPAGVKALPSSATPTMGHKYLVETNPVLTDLKQFMSSDYLLGGLGYDPDNSWKRLGDGFYEQRLIQQAVIARTGQRFIDGLTSDEAMFRYLMDNAIASKDELNLSVGVSLTAEQVAALTHDIVWMEDQVINGEHVLVPVLYLAQAENRLAPNGALIQGQNVTLISGHDLQNSGTLRATNNLNAKAENTLANGGLIEAGNRLDLLATNDIVNQAGGVISGRDVTLQAVNGDVINERTITSFQRRAGDKSLRDDFADSAARIEAANDLSISAGRDITNVGGTLQSGRDLDLKAGRDITIASAQKVDSEDRGSYYSRSSVEQFGSTVSAGQDLTIKADRDISAIASKIEAKRDVSLAAAENLTLASAANEEHFYSKSKKVTTQEDHVEQQATTVTAGRNVNLKADQDLTLVSSKVEAGQEAYLYAGKDLNVLAAQDSDYTLYDMKKKGSFGSLKTKHDEVTDVRNVVSEIKAGTDLTLVSNGDQTYQAAKLQSGNDLTLQSGGDITFEAVKDLHQETHTKSSNSLAWNSAKGKGNTDETLKQSELVAQGQLVIQAANQIHIDVKQVNQQTVSQSIDAMVKADPSLAWIKQAEAQGNIDWRQVKEVHDSFKYSQSGLGAGAMLALAIVVTALTAGAASAAIGSAAGATAGSSSVMAAATTTEALAAGANFTAAGWGNIALTAAITSAASNAAISTINNQGNLGAAFKDVTSADALKGYVFSGLSAGIGANFAFNPTNLGFNWESVGTVATKTAVDAGVKTVLYGGDIKSNLINAAVSNATDIVSAVAFKEVGDYADGKMKEAIRNGDTQVVSFWAESGAGRIAMHAAVGGMLTSAMGDDFVSGAVAAGASQALARTLDGIFTENNQLREGMSQVVGIVAAGLAGKDVNNASYIAGQADRYNRQMHSNEAVLLDELASKDPEHAHEWDAAACALVSCSAGVPPTDPNYASLKALEAEGALYMDLQKSLKATGLFSYSFTDQSTDWVSRHGEGIYYTRAAGDVTGGAALAISSGVGGATTCAGTFGLGCGLAGLGVVSGIDQYKSGLDQWNEGFVSTEGKTVLDSFRTGTFPGDTDVTNDIVGFVGSTIADTVLERVGGRVVEKVIKAVDNKIGKVVGSSINNTVAGSASSKISPEELALVTSNENAHSLARHGGSVTDEQLIYRALSGIAPDGHVKSPNGKTVLPPLSSAFYSDELLIKADQAIRNGGALQAAIARNPGESFITVKPADVGDLGVSLGRGFERISGSKLNPALQGPPNMVQDLRSAQATYEFNPSTNKWETVTIFPAR
jgi:filamentous hemagglutinin